MVRNDNDQLLNVYKLSYKTHGFTRLENSPRTHYIVAFVLKQTRVVITIIIWCDDIIIELCISISCERRFRAGAIDTREYLRIRLCVSVTNTPTTVSLRTDAVYFLIIIIMHASEKKKLHVHTPT